MHWQGASDEYHNVFVNHMLWVLMKSSFANLLCSSGIPITTVLSTSLRKLFFAWGFTQKK